MQIIDPEVSKRKFVREVRRFRANEKLHVARGIWLMDATFPTATLGFVAVNCTPAVLVVAVAEDVGVGSVVATVAVATAGNSSDRLSTR